MLPLNTFLHWMSIQVADKNLRVEKKGRNYAFFINRVKKRDRYSLPA